jgi:hypothetical protein
MVFIVYSDLHQRLVASQPVLIDFRVRILRAEVAYHRVKDGAVLVLFDTTPTLRRVQQIEDRGTWRNTRHYVVVDVGACAVAHTTGSLVAAVH